MTDDQLQTTRTTPRAGEERSREADFEPARETSRGASAAVVSVTCDGSDDPAAALLGAMEHFPTAHMVAIDPVGYFVTQPGSLPFGDHPPILGRSMLDLVLPADRLATVEAWDRVLHDGTSAAEVHFTNAPGKDVIVRFFDVRATYGVLAGLVVSDGDDAEIVIPKSSNLPPRLVHLKKDANGNILEVGATVSEILGWKVEDFVGHRSTEFIHPEDLDRAVGSWFEMLGEPGATSRCRYRHRRSDGSWCWVDVTNLNLLDQQEACVNVEIIDVSDEMAEIEALRGHERLLADLTEALPIGVMQIDQRRHVSFVNRLFGELLGETAATNPSDHVARLTETDRRGFEERLDGALLGIDGEFEVTTMPILGNSRTCHLMFRPVAKQEASPAIDGVLVSVMDVTSLRHAEEIAGFELRQLEAAQSVAHLGSFEQDPESGMLEASAELGRLIGIETSGPIPLGRLIEVVHPDDRQRLGAAIGACVNDHKPVDVVHRLVLRDGTLRWVHAQAEWVAAGPRGRDRMLGTVLDITERKFAEDALAFEGVHDKLTGLANRTAFVEQVNRALGSSQLQAKHVAVLLLDVDDFKTVNDSLGHAMGDELLVDFSRRLVATTRRGDTIARFGGDEFAVLIESGDARQVAEQLAQRIIEAFRVPFILAGHEAELSASIGIAMSDLVGDSGALLRNADLAMYLAKQHGKGRYEIAEAGLQERALERLMTIADLHHGVEHDEFEVYYQAIVHTDTSTLAGVEALVRWNHPTRGLVFPGSFIALAESCGLVVPIGQGVRREACRQLAAWRRAGLVENDFYVSINLSPRQLGDPTLVDNVVRDLDEAGLPSSALVLEITETTLMADFDSGLKRLQSLKATGLRVALDDYGTGYSSLARLSELPIDVVKIDKSFIDAVAVDSAGRAIVQSVIDTATALGMVTVAEGVEEQGQRDVLDVMGCTYIQGFLFSKPLPSVDIEPTLRALQAPRPNKEPRASFINVVKPRKTPDPEDEPSSTDDQHHEPSRSGQARIRACVAPFLIVARTLLSAPSLCINIFWGAGLVLISILAVSKQWSSGQLVSLLVLIGVCICGFALRASVGERLPRWTLHIDLFLAVLICGTVVAVGDSSKLDFSEFFVWVVLYAAMYLGPAVALAYLGAICSEYAVVLSVGPSVASPATAWLILLISTAVIGTVVLGVVGVLRAAGHEDPLTGLPNRRSFDEDLNEELERSRRSSAPLSVAMIDLDGFKDVNDQLGHAVGDDLLRELARAWLPVVQEGGDFLARIGGDEFVVIAPNSDDLAIRRVAERLANSLPDRVRCSIGTATWDRSESPSDLVHRADQKMYERKLRQRRDERIRPA